MTTPVDPATQELVARAREITEQELKVFEDRTPGSKAQDARASTRLPMGVPSSFQFYDPYPIVVRHAKGTRVVDVDGNEFVDFNLGYGSLLAGHSHPVFADAIREQLEHGTLYVTPCEANAEVAGLLIERFPFDLVRFTNSGTESTMDAIRAARGFTGKSKIVKAEGAYHGHHDEVLVSVKPPVAEAGDAHHPLPVPYSEGLSTMALRDVLVVPYNDLEALEETLAEHGEEIAAYILEPVAENMGIVLPAEGYLQGVREITRRHGVLMICDEVKTGITAHHGGASTRYGIEPDLICLAKSIGGGVPVGAFGGRGEIMEGITSGRVMHLGTFNGNPLVMAASRAVLRDIVTQDVFDEACARNRRLLAACQAEIESAGLPAHTVEMGAKGCVTYAPEPVRTYRDYKATDFDLAYAHWIWMMNRGIFLPPGLDEQWLISVQHSDDDIDRHVEAFRGFVAALVA